MSGEDQFEIRIICDKRAHPAHKGRPWHVTALSPYETDDGTRAWTLSEREMEQRPDPLWYSVIPGYRLTDEPMRRPPFHYIESTDETPLASAGQEHERFELECRRCHAKVSAAGTTMFALLDKLQANGIRQVSLQMMGAYLRGAPGSA